MLLLQCILAVKMTFGREWTVLKFGNIQGAVSMFIGKFVVDVFKNNFFNHCFILPPFTKGI